MNTMGYGGGHGISHLYKRGKLFSITVFEIARLHKEPFKETVEPKYRLVF